jgi:hypothetical protein
MRHCRCGLFSFQGRSDKAGNRLEIDYSYAEDNALKKTISD